MIALGLDDMEKRDRVVSYCRDHGIAKIFALGPKRFWFEIEGAEWLDWPDLIKYRHYYRLQQSVDKSTLIVLNECLQTQNRYSLTYNCIRKYLLQTPHQIILQHLPIIDTFEDFMVLVDFDTRTKWKFQPWRRDMLSELRFEVQPHPLVLTRDVVAVDSSHREAYSREKRRIIDGLGSSDPHTIPRKLHLFTGRCKLSRMDDGARYVARNARMQLQNVETYRDVKEPGRRDIVEFCHGFGEFCAFLAVSKQEEATALVADLPVDHWYFDRFNAWAKRLDDAYAEIS